MCKSRIEKAAKAVKGVSTAEWNKETKVLQLDFDPAQTNLDAISKAVAKVGHDTNKDKASQAVYDALPGCCKYR
jgi:Cu(I)/Ag(I) efflux system membrane fusion protein